MPVHKYIRKAVDVEAIQWMGDNTREVLDFVGDFGVVERGCVELATMKGMRTARVGSWIIKENWNNIYVCSPKIFDWAYQAAPLPSQEEDAPDVQETEDKDPWSGNKKARISRMFGEEESKPKEDPGKWADTIVDSLSNGD